MENNQTYEIEHYINEREEGSSSTKFRQSGFVKCSFFLCFKAE